jgi:hypothetical protein
MSPTIPCPHSASFPVNPTNTGYMSAADRSHPNEDAMIDYVADVGAALEREDPSGLQKLHPLRSGG